MKKRQEKINETLRFWQERLNLGSWQINFELKQFTRTDYIQSGDIKANLDKKNATVLISKKETGRDDYIILHELVHLVLWEMDIFTEKNIIEKRKNHYFELLEKTCKDITDILFKEQK